MAEETTPPTTSTFEYIKHKLVGNGLLLVSAGLMAVTLYLIYFWVPTERTLGVSFRILFFHVPVAILALASIVLVAVASAAHLATRNNKWDHLAYSAAEVGSIFVTLAIITGTIWDKPTFGVWWTWDPKLTTTLILWFIYAGYLMLRAYGPKGSQGARYGGVLALIGAIDVPIIYMAANWWAAAHPSLKIGPLATEESYMDPNMEITLVVSLITFVILYVYLLIERVSLKVMEDNVNEIRWYVN